MLFVDQGVGSNLVSMLGATSLAVTPTQTTTYTLTLNGSVSAQVTVTVVPLPLVTSFSASPAFVNPGGSSTLTAVFSGGTGTVDQGIGTVTSGIGTSTGPITANTTYTLTVTNSLGDSTTAQVTVVPVAAGLPPPVNGLQVWLNSPVSGSTGSIKMDLRIDNKTTARADLSTVTLRYWYQEEGLGTALIFSSDYVSIGHSNAGKMVGQVVTASPSAPGADHYFELSFSGTLAVQGDTSNNDQFNLQVNSHTASYQGAVDVKNDYSYDGGASKLYEKKITLHDKDGNVLWGTPPGGKGSPGPTDGGN
jgi:hypothetical protein